MVRLFGGTEISQKRRGDKKMITDAPISIATTCLPKAQGLLGAGTSERAHKRTFGFKRALLGIFVGKAPTT